MKLSTLLLSFFLVTSIYTQNSVETPIKRVYIDVVGDLMHSGHVAMFKNAKTHGDYLIVGVHSDETVASYKRWPIMNMQERIDIISACKYVDEVVADAPLRVTKEYIEKHHIDLIIHGDDLSQEHAQQWYRDPIDLGIFQTVPYTQGISTTDLIKRITAAYGK